MKIIPKSGFRDFKTKAGKLIKSNGMPMRVQDFEGNFSRNDIINYMHEFCEKAKQKDATVRYCVMLKFDSGEYSNGDIQSINEAVHLQDVFYDTHTDENIIGFRIIIMK